MEYYAVKKEWCGDDTERSPKYISLTEKNKVWNSVYGMLPFVRKKRGKYFIITINGV